MTCKNCIYEKICDNLIAYGLPWKDGEYPAEKWCDHFKNKADVVEVVRCKDCKYYTEHYQDTFGEYGRCDHPQQEYDIECFDMWVATDPDDYCSYGERKEQ